MRRDVNIGARIETPQVARYLKSGRNQNAKWWRRVAFRFTRVLP